MPASGLGSCFFLVGTETAKRPIWYPLCLGTRQTIIRADAQKLTRELRRPRYPCLSASRACRALTGS